jgi:hypothetical protein
LGVRVHVRIVLPVLEQRRETDGLLVWQDDKTFIRLERNIWTTPDGQTVCFPPLLEYWKDDTYMDTNPQVTPEKFFQGRSTYLRLERTGDKIRASLSHDGTKWDEVKTFTAELPKKVKVGVAALNTSKKPFTVEFEDFKLTTK